MSEAISLAVTPEMPHKPLSLTLAGLVGFTLVLALAGASSFERRTIL